MNNDLHWFYSGKVSWIMIYNNYIQGKYLGSWFTLILFRDDERESKERQRLQKEKMDRIRFKAFRNYSSHWKTNVIFYSRDRIRFRNYSSHWKTDVIFYSRDRIRFINDSSHLKTNVIFYSRDRNRARNTLATWKEFVQVLPNYNLKDIGTRYSRML